eukprot:scaffold216427_cov17-Tisochrysis_lutea.AAC.1
MHGPGSLQLTATAASPSSRPSLAPHLAWLAVDDDVAILADGTGLLGVGQRGSGIGRLKGLCTQAQRRLVSAMPRQPSFNARSRPPQLHSVTFSSWSSWVLAVLVVRHAGSRLGTKRRRAVAPGERR